MGTADGSNFYKMSMNLEFEVLQPGWYTVGVDDAPYSNYPAPSDNANFNLHIYSAQTPVHFYDGQNVVSTTQDAEFIAADTTPITDDGVDATDFDPNAGGEGGEVCTAAGCTGGGITGPGDSTPDSSIEDDSAPADSSADSTVDSGTCTDVSTFKDSYGDSCAWYDSQPGDCGKYDSTNAADGKSMEDCCACGGGQSAVEETTPEPAAGGDSSPG